MKLEAAGGPAPALRRARRARLATATLFFASGCGLGSWLPHFPDVKIWHGLSDGVLRLALPALAGGAVAALPVAGALTARYGSRRYRARRPSCSAPSCLCRCSPRIFRCSSRPSSYSASGLAPSTSR